MAEVSTTPDGEKILLSLSKEEAGVLRQVISVKSDSNGIRELAKLRLSNKFIYNTARMLKEL